MPCNTLFSLRPSLSSPGPQDTDSSDPFASVFKQQSALKHPLPLDFTDDEAFPLTPTQPASKRSCQEASATNSPADTALVDAATNASSDKTKKIEPPFADDYKPGGKLKAADYAAEAEAVTLHSARAYEVLVLVMYAFPATTMHSDWATTNFKNSCRLFKKQYKITNRIITLVITLACTACCTDRRLALRLVAVALESEVPSSTMCAVRLCHMVSSSEVARCQTRTSSFTTSL
jgi:hypothetical protein